MKLVIAEKPSVAMSIAKVLGVKTRKDGYLESKDYIISWCVGHLVGLANPDSYDEKYAKWNMDDLPIIPNEYKYDISKATKKQFGIVKKLMNDKKVDIVVNACDAGREGELIFRLVYNMAGCKKNIKRLWISSMESEAILSGFNNLKDGRNYENLFLSALARAKADWIVGINFSRLYSCLYKQNYSVGRVQTPTLAMIVKRDEEIINFKKEKYYNLELSSDNIRLSTARINDKILVDKLLETVGDTIKISNVIKEEKITKPSLPFDLTTLQRECNKYFGYSAKETLDYAQSLYEKKLITYPRTDSRYLTEDMITNTINNIFGKNDFDTNRIKVVFNSAKVTDHHAIIPTISSMRADMDTISENEMKIYKLILNKLHSSVGYPLVENTTKIVAEFNGYEFTSSGKVIVNDGFTSYLKEYKAKKTDKPNDIILPNLNIGDILTINDKQVVEKFTSPPSKYTEDTLLKAMEQAGVKDLDKDIEVERQGIGTPATRAGIIENLISKELIKRDKKNLIPTTKGSSLIAIVSEFLKEAKTTAEWEKYLYNISKGTYTEDRFLKSLEESIEKEIKKYSSVKGQTSEAK